MYFSGACQLHFFQRLHSLSVTSAARSARVKLSFLNKLNSIVCRTACSMASTATLPSPSQVERVHNGPHRPGACGRVFEYPSSIAFVAPCASDCRHIVCHFSHVLRSSFGFLFTFPFLCTRSSVSKPMNHSLSHSQTASMRLGCLSLPDLWAVFCLHHNPFFSLPPIILSFWR